MQSGSLEEESHRSHDDSAINYCNLFIDHFVSMFLREAICLPHTLWGLSQDKISPLQLPGDICHRPWHSGFFLTAIVLMNRLYWVWSFQLMCYKSRNSLMPGRVDSYPMCLFYEAACKRLQDRFCMLPIPRICLCVQKGNSQLWTEVDGIMIWRTEEKPFMLKNPEPTSTKWTFSRVSSARHCKHHFRCLFPPQIMNCNAVFPLVA